MTDAELAAIEERAGETHVLEDIRALIAEVRRLRQYRTAMDEHFRATSTWTGAFQPGGPFEGVLVVGDDITVAGGQWLVNQVLRLTVNARM